MSNPGRRDADRAGYCMTLRDMPDGARAAESRAAARALARCAVACGATSSDLETALQALGIFDQLRKGE